MRCLWFRFRYVAERSPQWFETLKSFFETTPTAAVGEVCLLSLVSFSYYKFRFYVLLLVENLKLIFLNFVQIGLDKGSKGREIDFSEQVSGLKNKTFFGLNGLF